MRIVHINISDTEGGAALAVRRLHEALREQKAASSLLVSRQHSSTGHSASFHAEAAEDIDYFHKQVIQSYYSNDNRSDISNTHFSLSMLGTSLAQHPLVRDADIIHLHWVASFQNAQSIRALLELNKPIFWTLHDAAPFTGGCHFPAGCEKFTTDCSGCPQLRSDPFDLPAALLLEKKMSWQQARFNLIAPSRWIAEKARASALFGRTAEITVIPNGINTRVFTPHSMQKARSALGIPADARYILCGAHHGMEKRKGFACLARALKKSFADPGLSNTKILWTGGQPAGYFTDESRVICLGKIEDEQKMALAYAAADVFVLPSLEDNLPNMFLEAMSCGTPVVAFNTGGMAEVIQNEVHGLLSPLGNEEAMAQDISSILSSRAMRDTMAKHCRELIEKEYNTHLAAQKHLEVYGHALALSAGSIHPAAEDAATPLVSILPELTLHSLAGKVKALLGQKQELDKQLQARMGLLKELELYRQQRELQLAACRCSSRAYRWINKFIMIGQWIKNVIPHNISQ